MNLLDRISKHGTYKKAGNTHGGEYHGPCPVCGGTDRFHCWPEQGDHGTFWCRGCDLGGDAIEYLMKVEGLTFPDACKEVGKEIPVGEDYQAPRFRRPNAAENFQPRAIAAPADLWIEHASKLVDWAHQQLLANPDQLTWLAARGITLEAVKQFQLGWNPGEKGKDLYRAREAWGLESSFKNDGTTKKKLWLPIGLVIPCYVGDTLRRIRIRIPNDRRQPGSLPYYLVPGSSMDTFITRTDATAWIITEAELDAIAIHAQAGDLCGAMAMGNSTAKPTATAFDLLVTSIWIGNALDYDAREVDGKYENPGGVGWLWWKKQFAQAERWPVPVGKDPGDCAKSGISLRDWITAGLPPALTMAAQIPAPAPLRPANPTVTPASHDHDPTGPVAAPITGEGTPLVHNFTAKDGREFTVTDNQAEYNRLITAGKIVFDSREIAYVKATGADPDTAARFIDMKEVFPGAKVTSGERLQP